MDNQKLKEEIEQAKETVEGLPEPFKSKTYDKLLERILDAAYGAKSQKKAGNVARSKKNVAPREDDIVQRVINDLDRSKYEEIHNLKVLERSLYLLRIVREKLKIDGLSPSQIASILTDKFRIKTTKEAVSMSLMKTHYVDRIPTVNRGARTYQYKLMQKGEDYLKKVLESEENE